MSGQRRPTSAPTDTAIVDPDHHRIGVVIIIIVVVIIHRDRVPEVEHVHVPALEVAVEVVQDHDVRRMIGDVEVPVMPMIDRSLGGHFHFLFCVCVCSLHC